MNVLLLDQFSDPGGAQQVLLELLPAIRRRGWSALAGLPGAGKLCDAFRAAGVEVAPIDCGPLARTPRLAAQVADLARRCDAQLVYLNGPRLLPAAALARLRCPVLFHSHSRVRSAAARSAAGMALAWMEARVVANCEFVAAPWRPFVPAERLSIVRNGVAGPPQPAPPRTGPPRIACIGRISPEKGQREFVEAAARIHAALPACRFAIYGDVLFGSVQAERYAAEVRSAAAGLPVEFPGWVADISAALAQTDLLLVPSVGPEATTRVILEALAAGVPSVAFHTGGIPEVIADGENGFLVRSVEEMARLTVELLSGDPARRTAMSRSARAAWERDFRLDRFHDAILNVMEEWAYGGRAATSASRS